VSKGICQKACKVDRGLDWSLTFTLYPLWLVQFWTFADELIISGR